VHKQGDATTIAAGRQNRVKHVGALPSAGRKGKPLGTIDHMLVGISPPTPIGLEHSP